MCVTQQAGVTRLVGAGALRGAQRGGGERDGDGVVVEEDAEGAR